MTIQNLLRKPEFYYWFLIPTIIAVFVLIKSILIGKKKPSILNWIFTILIIILLGFSEYILYVIFFTDALPTYLPHFGIGLALIIYGIQFFVYKNTTTNS